MNVFGFSLLAVFIFALYAAFWGGIIFFTFWCAQHFGLI